MNWKKYIIWMIPASVTISGSLWYAVNTRRHLSGEDVAALAYAVLCRTDAAAATCEYDPREWDVCATGCTFGSNALRNLSWTKETADGISRRAASIPRFDNPLWLSAEDADAIAATDRFVVVSQLTAPKDTYEYENGVFVHTFSGTNAVRSESFRTASFRAAKASFPCLEWYFQIYATWSFFDPTNCPVLSWFGATNLSFSHAAFPGGTYWTTNMGPSVYETPAEHLICSTNGTNVVRRVYPDREVFDSIRAAVTGVTATVYYLPPSALTGTNIFDYMLTATDHISLDAENMDPAVNTNFMDVSSVTNVGSFRWSETARTQASWFYTNSAFYYGRGESEITRLRSASVALPYPCIWAVTNGLVSYVRLYAVAVHSIESSMPLEHPGESWKSSSSIMSGRLYRLSDWGSICDTPNSQLPAPCPEGAVNPAFTKNHFLIFPYAADPLFHGKVAVLVWSCEAPDSAADLVAEIGGPSFWPKAVSAHSVFGESSADYESFARWTCKITDAGWIVMVGWRDPFAKIEEMK